MHIFLRKADRLIDLHNKILQLLGTDKLFIGPRNCAEVRVWRGVINHNVKRKG